MMEYLANNLVRIYQSEQPDRIYTYTPGICVLPGGRLLVTMDLGGPGVAGIAGAVSLATNRWVLGKAFISDDRGVTWRHVADFPFCHARPFTAGGSVYILGQANDLCIIRSNDNGESWSSPHRLTEGERWHQSACNVWYREDKVYLVMEKTVLYAGEKSVGWPVCYLIPILLRAAVTDDLTKCESWTFASEIRFIDAVHEGELNHHGIPFYKSLLHEDERCGDETLTQPVGWLETNVVQILDKKHYWYDESGRTFNLFMRAHTAGSGYCAIAKAVEQEDGSIKTQLIEAPSGRTWVFLPMLGGQMRFHMLYDPKTELYWLLSTQATDSMTRIECLSSERYNIPCDERQRLQLSFSKNCVDWCFAGMVATGDSEKQSRHYAGMAIDGDDLVAVSRSGDENASSAHDSNFISFHRIKDFRSLVY